MSLRVLELFGIATLQDAGRSGFRRFGVPPGGAFDTESFALTNRILGNPSDASVLEMGLGGGRFAVEEDACLSLVGAEGPASLNGAQLPPQSSFEVRRGDELEVRAFQRGVRAYLGISGGFEGKVILGSRSGERILRGSTLETVNTATRLPSRALRTRPSTLAETSIRCLAGPRAENADRWELESAEFEVSQRSNRAGVRLTGLEGRTIPEFPSEPSCVGAVQLTFGGELIVVGPDGPTIGGYPVVAVVCAADRSRVAQLAPGGKVRLRLITQDEARLALKERRADLDATFAEIAIADPTGVDRGAGPD